MDKFMELGVGNIYFQKGRQWHITVKHGGFYMFKIGEKVTYVTLKKKEKGIVKSISDDNNTFVVYHCGEDWENFMNYTAARTSNSDIIRGW